MELEKLLELENTKDTYPISYLDIDKNNLISYLNNKDCNEKNPWDSKKRQKAKIGRVIKQLLHDKSASEIEQDVNKYKSAYKQFKENQNFELVDGDDIAYWYNCDNYEEESGTLGNSCMRDVEDGYLEMYTDNTDSVQLLILKNKEGDKLLGRALVWNTKKPEGRKFMDRIYTINPEDVEMFISYAKDKNWIYKSKQGFNVGKFTDKNNNEYKSIEVHIRSGQYDQYPYLDTLYYYDSDSGILSNDGYHDMELLGTDGYPSEGEQRLEILKQELNQESLYYIASTYGIEYLLNNINDKEYLNDHVDGETEYYYSSQGDFLDSYSYYIEADEDSLIHAAGMCWGIFYETREDEIKEYLKDKYNFESDDEQEIKRFIANRDIKKEVIENTIPDNKELFNDDNLEKLKEDMWEYLDQEDIIRDTIRSQYSSARDVLEQFWNIDSVSQELVKSIENYVDQEKVVKDIITDMSYY